MMALYKRARSPFFWMNLSAPGRRTVQQSTRIPWDAPTKEERASLKRAAQTVYVRAQAAHVLAAHGAQKPAMRTATYLHWYEQHVATHHKGHARERSVLKQLRADFGTLQLAEITRDRILEWRTARAAAVAGSSVNRELDVLKAALAKAVPRYLDTSPATGVPRLKHRARERQILTRADEGRLLAVLSPHEQTIVIAALDTLVRAGDLLRLTWTDDHGRYLTIGDPKGGHAYQVPVSDRLRGALDTLPRDGPYVFRGLRSPNGRTMRLWHMLADGCRRAGIPPVQFHGLRHTGASRLAADGVDLITIRTLGNWASLKQLTRYAHPTNAHLVSAVNGIGAGVEAPSALSPPVHDPDLGPK